MVVKMSKSSNFSRYRRMEIKLSDGTTHLIALRVKIFVIPRRIMSTFNDRRSIKQFDKIKICFCCYTPAARANHLQVVSLLFVVVVVQSVSNKFSKNRRDEEIYWFKIDNPSIQGRYLFLVRSEVLLLLYLLLLLDPSCESESSTGG